MATRWIDFTELKQAVRRNGGIRELLARYGFLQQLTEKGDGKLVGPCPIHGSTDQASTAFQVDCDRDVWHCFSQCTTDRGKKGGGVLELVMLVEDCTLREAGEKLASWFDLRFERPTRVARQRKKSAKVSQETAPHTAVATHFSERRSAINPPLERPLKSLYQDHAYLFGRGLTVPTISTFGLGFCSRGIMRGRIAIPLHDATDNLIGYAGRAVDETQAKEEGKYKLPKNLSKKHVLFNLNRARNHIEAGLIVVEGYFDAMRVHQAGFPNVVALMGATVSDDQQQLLLDCTDRLALMFDGDEAGIACMREFYRRLRRKLFLKEIHLGTGEQPDALSEDRIRALLQTCT